MLPYLSLFIRPAPYWSLLRFHFGYKLTASWKIHSERKGLVSLYEPHIKRIKTHFVPTLEKKLLGRMLHRMFSLVQ